MIRQTIDWLVQSPILPLLAWTLGIAALTQAYKRAMRAAGRRHHWLVERTLPLVPVAIGLVSGGAFPHELGIGTLIRNGHHSHHALGAFYGAGVGLVSSGVFRAILELAPASVADSLTLHDAEGDS